jgi:hypothetical protein
MEIPPWEIFSFSAIFFVLLFLFLKLRPVFRGDSVDSLKYC